MAGPIGNVNDFMYTTPAFSLQPDRVVQGACVAMPAQDHDAGLERYPRLRSDFPVLDAAYRLALRELEQLRTPDGCWDTGALWKGVWTRDISYSVLLSLGLLDPRTARACLLKKTGAPGLIQDTGTGGSWPVSTDRVTWVPAAWEIYLATGRRDWLEEIFPVIERSLRADAETVMDPATGLARGESSFLDWRAQSYPAWMDPSDIYGSTCLGTNAVHARAWELAGRCAAALGRDPRPYASRGAAIRHGINTHLWSAAAGRYGQFRYGRHHPLLSDRVETLGAALCVLFGIADEARARATLASLPLEPFGLPCFHPHIPGQRPYHNRAVWPFVVAFAGWAAARAGHLEVATHSLACLLRAATLFGTHKENMVAETGSAPGTAINSDRQLWSVAGMLAAVYRILFGLEAQPDRLTLAPCIPVDWRGRYELAAWPWRAGVLDLVVRGAGCRVASFRVDGREVPERCVPAGLDGRHTVEVEMEPDTAPPLPARRVAVTYAPAAPETRIENGAVRWMPVERACSYRVLVNGQAVATTQGISFTPPATPGRQTEVQVIALDDHEVPSFASAPLAVSENAIAVGPGDAQAVRLENRADQRVAYTAEVAEGGRYAIAARYANGQNDSEHDNKCAVRTLLVDGQPAGKLVLPQRGKGRWDDFGYSHPLIIELAPGLHHLDVRLTLTDLNMNVTVNEALLAGLRLTRLT